MGAKCSHAEPQCFSTGITRIQCPCYAGILPPYAAPLLGRSLSVSQQSGTARQLRAALALRSLTLPQRCGPYSTETPQSLPGVQDTAVPAVGTDSVSHRRSVRQHTPPPRIRAARHRLCRFTPRITIVAKYLNS